MLAVLCYVCGYGIVCPSICVCGSIFVYYMRAYQQWGGWFLLTLLRHLTQSRVYNYGFQGVKGVGYGCQDADFRVLRELGAYQC